MNKSELISEVASKTAMPKKDAEKAVNAFIDTVKEAIAQKDKVQLIGFGTFEARVRKARNGKNPRFCMESRGETSPCLKANGKS